MVENVFEGYDPNLNTGEILDKHMVVLIDVVMNYNPEKDTEDQFKENLKIFLRAFIGELIDEL